MCRTGIPSSRRLLARDVFDAAARHDFDGAVVLFGEGVEAMLEERVGRVARATPKNVKPIEYVPRWTLAQLLAIDADEDDEDDTDQGNTIGPRAAADAEPLDLGTLDWGE